MNIHRVAITFVLASSKLVDMGLMTVLVLVLLPTQGVQRSAIIGAVTFCVGLLAHGLLRVIDDPAASDSALETPNSQSREA